MTANVDPQTQQTNLEGDLARQLLGPQGVSDVGRLRPPLQPGLRVGLGCPVAGAGRLTHRVGSVVARNAAEQEGPPVLHEGGGAARSA